MIVIHTTGLLIRTEPGAVVLDQFDSASQMSARGCMTAVETRRLAAELLMAADKADFAKGEGDYAEGFN